MSEEKKGMIRDLAVTLVDGRHGYTYEFSSSPEAHRDEYDVCAREIEAALRVNGLTLSKVTP